VSSSLVRARSALYQAGHVPFPSPRAKSGRWSGFLCRPLIAQLSRCAKSIVPKFAAGHYVFLTGDVLVSRQALTQFTSTQSYLSGTKCHSIVQNIVFLQLDRRSSIPVLGPLFNSEDSNGSISAVWWLIAHMPKRQFKLDKARQFAGPFSIHRRSARQ
jgi:hypothetical protein